MNNYKNNANKNKNKNIGSSYTKVKNLLNEVFISARLNVVDVHACRNERKVENREIED